MSKSAILALLTVSPIIGALLLMVWRCAVALHRNQLLRSLVWASTAFLWVVGWSLFADQMILEATRW